LQKDNRKKIGLVIRLLTLSAFFSILFLATENVEANVLDDIAETFNEKIFDGESLYGAKMLLSLSIIISIVLVLAITEFNLIGSSITLLALIGFLTFIEWLEAWLLILSAIIFAAFFGKRIVVAITKGESSED